MTWSTSGRLNNSPVVAGGFATVDSLSISSKGAMGWWIVRTENKKIMAIVMSSENLVIEDGVMCLVSEKYDFIARIVGYCYEASDLRRMMLTSATILETDEEVEN